MTNKENAQTILLVEDEALIALGEARLLRKYGYNVIVATTGPEAVTAIDRAPEIDLVLMDVNLGSGMDGTQTAETILQRRDLPLIFLSSHTEREVVEGTEGITSYGYIVKNSGETVFIASIKMAFRLFEARARERENSEKLRENETRFHTMFERHDAVMLLLDPENGKIIDANLAAESFYGYPRAALQSMSIDAINTFSPAEIKAFRLKAAQEQGNYFIFPHRLASGELRTVEVHTSPLIIEGRTALFSIIHDITERIQAEARSHSSETRYRHISAIISDIAYSCVAFAGAGFALDWLSGAVEQITGYTPDEVLEQHCWGFLVLEEDGHRFNKLVTGLAPGEKGKCELRIRHKDGSLRWLSSNAECVENAEAQTHCLYGGLVDITERKQMESELRRWANTFEHAEWGITVGSVDGKTLEAINPAFARMHGRTVAEMIGQPLLDLFAPEVRADVLVNIKLAQEKGQHVWESVHLRKDGSRFPVLINVAAVPDEKGKVLYRVVNVQDITKRKQAEDSLAEQKQKLDYILEGTNAGTWEWNVQTGETTFNERWAEIVGYSLAELAPISIDTWVKLAHPDDLETSNTLLQKHFKGELDYYEYEARLRHKRGEWVWVLDRGKVALWTEDGKPLLMFGTHQDITARKQAEEALNHTNGILEQQKKALGILNQIIAIANQAEDLTTLFQKILEAALELLEYDGGGIYLVDPGGTTAHVAHSYNLPPGFIARVESVTTTQPPYDSLFARGEPLITEHYEQVSPEIARLTGFCSVVSVPLYSKERIIGALNVASKRRHVVSENERQTLLSIGKELGAIIERLTAENEAKNAVANLETLFNSIEEMVFLLDMQGNILRVNNTVYRRLKYTEEELVGKNVLLLHVPERRDEALRIVQAMIAGNTDSCPVPVLAKDGTRIEVETKVTRGWWNNQEVLIGVTRDVTARKQAEDALQKAFEEKQSLLRELQHRAKNSFALITSMINLMEDAYQTDETHAALAEMGGRVRAIAELYDLLYDNDTITDVQMDEYCERIVASLRFSGNIRFFHTFEPVTMPTRMAAPIGLILTELITNAIKHAFPGERNGTISISMKRTPTGAVIAVEDDGVGLPPGFDITTSESLGLTMVQVLTGQIRGQFKMERNGGTRCMVEFPNDESA